MATALGAGRALAVSYLLEPIGAPPPARAQANDAPLPLPRVVLAPVDPPEVVELLERVLALLAGAAPGLALADLRSQLGASAESLQRALVAGLRTKRLRRVGAHNKLRYLCNG